MLPLLCALTSPDPLLCVLAAGNGSVTYAEWVDFWKNVVAQPEYLEEDVIEEIDSIIEGGSWVDWNDGR